MLSQTVVLLALGACLATSVPNNMDKRQGVPVAEARGGAHHGGGHSAPAAASSYDTGSQGNLYYYHLKAFESEECTARTFCEMGAYSKSLRGSGFILGFVEPLVPEGMKRNMAIFKKAAFSGQETGKCNKYKCAPPKLI